MHAPPLFFGLMGKGVIPMDNALKQMDFFALKKWLKERNLTFKLEGWSCCIPDTILIFRGKELLYEGDYNSEVDYIHAAKEVESRLSESAVS